MKLDRSKITPEVLDQMREIIIIAGSVTDPKEWSDEMVLAYTERLLGIFVEMASRIRELFIEPMVLTMLEFTQSSAGQALQQYAQEMRRMES